MSGLFLTSPNGQFTARERYVLTTFLHTLGIPHGRQSNNGYVLWAGRENEPVTWHGIDLGLLAEAFDLLARTEEGQTVQRDRMGRFSFVQSEFTPEFRCRADEILDQFATTLSETLRKSGRTWRRQPIWPDGAPFAVCLTHDIDWTRKWSMRGVIGQIGADGLYVLRNPLDSNRWDRLAVDMGSIARRENPFWNLDEIARREKDFGFRSTFFFLADGRHPRDGDYSLNDPVILRQLEHLLANGFEIGLHGSYETLERPELLAGELERLQSRVGQVWGIRQHYLRFDVQKSLKAYEELGLRYDSTMGFADREGFRAGFSYPYYPYCIGEERPFRVLEIPLTVMDTTLQQYRGFDAEEAWTAVERQLSYVKKSGGCCTLLWHNTFFDDAKYPGYGGVYWRALAWIVEHGGWATTASEIWSWWQGPGRVRQERT